MSTNSSAKVTKVFEELLLDLRGSRDFVYRGLVRPEPRESRWIEHNLRSGLIHDSGYSNFVDELVLSGTDVLIDVGANYGYSVTTCEAFGYQGRYLSFEPLSEHGPALTTLQGLLGDSRFRFYPLGLSDFVGSFEIVTPVVSGQRLSALSFDVQVERSAEALSRNACASVPGLADLEIEELEIAFDVQSGTATTLDVVAREDPWLTERESRFALKIDAEGSEARIVQGGVSFLGTHQPPLYIEGPSKDTVDILRELGYEERVFHTDQPWNRLFV